LQSIRRKPEEFEVISKGGSSELGKGSYGQVKLVRDRMNGKEFAMKIVATLLFKTSLDFKKDDLRILFCRSS